MKKLTANKNDNRNSSRRKYYWFECECGNIVSRRSDSTAKFCSEPNCTKAVFNRHGKSETRLYSIWSGMRDRCINGNHKSSVHYKDKGISICKEWELFINFEEWALANGYTDKLTIDRKDILGDYTPENCEWVERAENTLRQVKDYHGNNKSIILTESTTNDKLSFKSIADAARFLISNNIPSTTNYKNVSETIRKAIRLGKPYYGYYYKLYKERDNEKQN